MIRLSILLVALTVFASSSSAQGTAPPLGPFSSTGVGFAPEGMNNDFYHRRPGTGPVAVFTPSTAGGPDYSKAAILASLPQLLQFTAFVAISTGNDMVPVVEGRLFPPLGNRAAWAALFFSITKGSVPEPGSPMYAMSQMPSGGGRAGADLFSWIALGSGPVLGTFFENALHLEVTAETLGITRSPQAEVAAADIPAALIVQNNGSVWEALFVERLDEVFFALSKASAALWREAGGFPNPNDISGATIFKADWSQANGWQNVGVWRSPDALGLGGALPNNPSDDEELDALAIDITLANPQIIFSTKLELPSTAPRLWVIQNGGLKAPLLDMNGAPLTARLGGNGTDVDAVCGLDPEKYEYGRMLGTPKGGAAAPPFVLSIGRTEVPQFPWNDQKLVFSCNAENKPPQWNGPLIVQCRVGDTGWSTMDGLPMTWTMTGTKVFELMVPHSTTYDVDFRVIAVEPGPEFHVSNVNCIRR